jgi:hypothetical protein
VATDTKHEKIVERPDATGRSSPARAQCRQKIEMQTTDFR